MIAIILTSHAGVGCDRETPTSPAPAPDVGVRVASSGPDAAAMIPRAPDFEDAAGTVREQGGAWTIHVPGHKPICLPFEAPAEARVDGVEIRFTLYLSPEFGPRGCRVVETLVSMRTAERDHQPSAP